MTTGEFIASFEGFAKRAYWDVNAWRIGFGSDTEGPEQIPVVQGMQTTLERALQNLTARIPEFQHAAIYGAGKWKGMGIETWNALNEHEKTAITSLVYNYGHLPISVIVGDPGKTAEQIRALQTANGGINRKRRVAEANFYLHGDAESKPLPQFPIPTEPVPSIPSGPAGRHAAIRDALGSMVEGINKQLDSLLAERQILDTAIASFEKLDSIPPIVPQPTQRRNIPVPSKPAISSLTMWGAVLSMASPLIEKAIEYMGQSGDPQIAMIGTILGGIMAIIGRGRADSKISGVFQAK